MAPRSNLADHLAEVLNVLCGRFRRAGDLVPNPGVLSEPRTFRAQVPPHAPLGSHRAQPYQRRPIGHPDLPLALRERL
jgi:hypothetical protein